MQFGIDEHNERIKPSFSGQKATCPYCKGIIVGKCGEIYVWHWQHQQDRECDLWQEHETDWHRSWKGKFPEDWQEVIIEKSGEKHIADVKTHKGIVIEFQNSSISASTIIIREDFYRNMIWVINAQPFKQNFSSIRSKVNFQLQQIEAAVSSKLTSLEENFKKELKNLSNEIDRNAKEIRSNKLDITYKNGNLEKLFESIKNIDTITERLMTSWLQNKYFHEIYISEIAETLKRDFGIPVIEISSSITKFLQEIKTCEETIEYIQKLENIVIESKSFKILSYHSITPKNFRKVIAIPKISRNTLFQEIFTFNSELEFLSFRFKLEYYDFAIDPEEKLQSLFDKVQEIKIALSALKNEGALIREQIKKKIIAELNNQVLKIEKEIEQLNNDLDFLKTQTKPLSDNHTLMTINQGKFLEESKIKIENEKNKLRFQAMNEQKGYYTINWKHERKSWRFASSRIFFDTGEDYLFEKLHSNVFKKITIKEFLDYHLPK